MREAWMSDSLASLFKSLTTGVYVVGVAHGRVRNAFTAAFVMQASYDPLLLALSINPHHSSYGLLKQGRAFSDNVRPVGACRPFRRASERRQIGRDRMEAMACG